MFIDPKKKRQKFPTKAAGTSLKSIYNWDDEIMSVADWYRTHCHNMETVGNFYSFS